MIYRLHLDRRFLGLGMADDDYKAITAKLEAANTDIDLATRAKSLAAYWDDEAKFEERHDEGDEPRPWKVGDVSDWGRLLALMTQRAQDALLPLFEETSEFLRGTFEGRRITLVNVMRTIEKLEIEQAAEDNDVFRVRPICWYTYVTDRFKEHADTVALSGLAYRQVTPGRDKML